MAKKMKCIKLRLFFSYLLVKLWSLKGMFLVIIYGS